MKRRFLSVFLALFLCVSLAVGVSAEEIFLYDEADLLTQQEEQAVSGLLAEISRKHNAQIIVGTVNDLQGLDIDDAIGMVYDNQAFGYGQNRDGVFLLISMETREYRILSNGWAGYAMGWSQIDAIGDAIEPKLSDGNYAAAMKLFARRCDDYLDGYRSGYPFEFGTYLLISLGAGLAVGLIVVLIMKAQLKSVRKQHQANAYMKSGSLHLTRSSDIYLYRNVSRTKRDTGGSSGSRSGGSRNIGGGSF